RIHIAGGKVRFLDRWIEQEGVETLRALFRQRHRWAWGTLQVFFRYVLSGRLLLARMPLGKKLDLHYYLSFWIVPFVVLLSFFLSLLDLAGVITITNSFGLAFLWANSFSFVPVIVLGLLWAGVPLRKMIYLVPLTVIYAYHWLPVLVLALVSIIGHKQPYWAKTERFAVEEVAG
ncbi:MAG: glycosyltransferase family 2 protein, partial [Candidatus Bipolaricaulota bacterium]